MKIILADQSEYSIRNDSGETTWMIESFSVAQELWTRLQGGSFSYTLVIENDDGVELDRVPVYDCKLFRIVMFVNPIIAQIDLERKTEIEKMQEDIDAMAEKVISTVDKYAVGKAYNKDDLFVKDEVLYIVLQSHTSQADWPPEITPALYRKIHGEPSTIPEWVQPTGAHDAYAKGDNVMHNGSQWESNIDANVWEPGVYGWDRK